jgi:hypothetical protein
MSASLMFQQPTNNLRGGGGCWNLPQSTFTQNTSLRATCCLAYQRRAQERRYPWDRARLTSRICLTMWRWVRIPPPQSCESYEGTQCPGGLLGHPVPGRYKYGNLAFQVEGVSNETVKYGYRFCVTRTTEWLQCKLQTHHLVRKGAPWRQDSNFQIESNIWSQIPEWARHQDILTDHLS